MKKAGLFFFVIIVSLSCSKLTHHTFNPPAWLQGSWKSDDGSLSWEITAHNLIFSEDFGGNSTSINYKKMYGSAGVTEESSGDIYSFTYESSSGGVTISTTQTFQKLNSSKMKNGNGNASVEFSKQ